MLKPLTEFRGWRFRPGWNRRRVLYCFSHGWSIARLQDATIMARFGGPAQWGVIEEIIRQHYREYR